LLKEDSVITIAIDEVEQTRLGELLRVIFPSKQITAITVVHNPSGQQGDNFSFTNEFAYFVYSDLKNVIGQEIRDESGIDVRTLEKFW
jgi:adenine-specific DNA-methyltransferase